MHPPESLAIMTMGGGGENGGGRDYAGNSGLIERAAESKERQSLPKGGQRVRIKLFGKGLPPRE